MLIDASHWQQHGSVIRIKHPVFHARTKHIKIDAHFIREKVAAKIVKIGYVPTAGQVADIFTKALPLPQFVYLASKLICSPMSSLMGSVRGSTIHSESVING